MNEYYSFEPDLIVEATSVCDRKCVGCYAPNFTSKISRDSLFTDYPNLFLGSTALRAAYLTLIPEHASNNNTVTTAIRGGEPTRHPQLKTLLIAAHSFSQSVYLETHGRWILDTEDQYRNQLLETLRKLETVVKVSYDQMHGLKLEELKEITSALYEQGIPFVVAITEGSLENFLAKRLDCTWIPNFQVIFQQKVQKETQLIRPKLGVVHVDGTHTGKLSVTSDFKAPNTPLESSTECFI